MSKTVSFVARDELADWLESLADAEMKSISSVCQDIVAAEYRRQNQSETDKLGQTQPDKGGSTPDALHSPQEFEFSSTHEAQGVKAEFKEYSTDRFDKRFKRVEFDEGTPGEVVKQLERRSEG